MGEPGLACWDLDFIACLLHLFVHTCPTSSHLLQSSTLHMVSSRLPLSLPHWIDIILMLFGTKLGISIWVTLGHGLQVFGGPSTSPFMYTIHIGHLKPTSRNCFYYCLMSGPQRAHDDMTYHLTCLQKRRKTTEL